MKTVTIHDAKTNLSKYIAAAKRGEKIYIGGFGNPEVMLSVISAPKMPTKRDFSALKGKVRMSDDAFSPQIDAEIAALMQGEGNE